MRFTLLASLLLCLLTPTTHAALDTHFESPPVHPIELSPSGDYLFAVNTADHRLSVFALGANGPFRVAEIPVGLEPVSVRAISDNEVWVVNHLSDDISIVRVDQGNVVRTLQVGDEPTDVVFNQGKAFVSVSQEDRLAIYQLSNLDAAPVSLPLQASDPRSLVAFGNKVYVTILDSGNNSTAIAWDVVDAMGGPPAPSPPMSGALPSAPRVSLVVQHDGTNWRDEVGGNWDAAVPFTLMDNDILEIDAVSLTVTNTFRGVGTTLFNVAASPAGDLYITNLEAFNVTRFEPNLKGRFLENRITRIHTSGSVTPRHLNEHINYNNASGSAAERAASLSTPLDIAVSDDGSRVYVAAFGSDRVGILDASGTVLRRVAVGEGPAGLALNDVTDILYVLNRFSSSISAIDLSDDSVVEFSLGFDPTTADIQAGRRLFYNGEISSAHGDLSCASCHIFGGGDNISWDLGDPQGAMTDVPPAGDPTGTLPDFHPMKGPMLTQPLKGLRDTEPLHWRGDRATFSDFNGAFVSLLGKSSEVSSGDFQQFEDFILAMEYPPNPFRELDGSLPASLDGADPANGEQLYLTGNLVGGLECVTCHTLPSGENGLVIPGGALGLDEAKVVPQLRGLYEKTGFDNDGSTSVRGFGFTHDGVEDELFTFLQFPAFTFNNDDDRRDVAAFLKAFDTGTHPGVGAQWTMDGTNEGAGLPRLTTLQSVADAQDIDLIAKGRDATGQARGWTYQGGGTWISDRASEGTTTTALLLDLAGAGTEITFTGVLTGEGDRLGVDRDEDSHRDRDELDAGSDPGDPNSTPGNPTSIDDGFARLRTRLWMAGGNPTGSMGRVGYQLGQPGPVRLDVYDVRGRRVRSLVDAPSHAAGTFDQAWNLKDDQGRRVTAGVYFLRLQTREANIGQRLTVLR